MSVSAPDQKAGARCAPRIERFLPNLSTPTFREGRCWPVCIGRYRSCDGRCLLELLIPFVRSVNYDQDGKPVVCAVEYVDTSVIRYNLVRQKAVDYQKG